MLSFPPHIAVIGAGVSGISAAAHLKSEGLRVTVFERASVSGGVWVFDSRVPFEPAYPSEKPSVAEFAFHDDKESRDPAILHSAPGPCYEGLKNNVPTELLELSLNKWEPNTPTFTTHETLRKYLQDTAVRTGVEEEILYNTRVESLSKDNELGRWNIKTTTWHSATNNKTAKSWTFDAVVVATGHYHAPNVPSIPGLAAWKDAFPSRIQHSKRYRNPKGFEDTNVLLIGGSTSATDIAKELGPIAKRIWQSTRNGPFDHPAFELPKNASRVAEIASFGPLQCNNASSTAIPGTVTLVDGSVLENVDRVIVCTGYQFSLPFLSAEYHRDDVAAKDADDKVLITDGTMLHNLHRDIFYIPDPSLIFVGVPFRIATFSLFEFQAIAVAAFLSGQATLPSQAEMRAEYDRRLKEKGLGKTFHSLMGKDVEYVADLMEWVNRGREPSQIKSRGYSKEWVDLQTDFIQKFLKHRTAHETVKP
ncbi:putative fad dependent [Phaeomoniella chlamydospora]|uniref:Putative fad dependent n=1 Tax=Phaeomoniella chlamydospora TaxID=158046 RepID=A0A0G2EH89_PHACM|nr:putative fad dependent [Phaeomoniella chlamydospora]